MRNQRPAEVPDQGLDDGVTWAAEGCRFPAAHVIGDLELPGLGRDAAKPGMRKRLVGFSRLDGEERGAATGSTRRTGGPISSQSISSTSPATKLAS